MADRVGQQLGNYHLLRLLGQGAFAEVYLGEHLYLERLAAIKVLHVQMDDETQEQFRREARTIAHLQHPHILQVHDFGIQEQTPYLVMEYTAGGTLRSQYPNGTRLPFEQMLMYVKQIASALDYAHQHRVIHRDVKPDNVLLTANGEVVLSDFGLAIVQRSLESSSSQTLAGTPLYIAPEQIQLHPCAASDQYALGIMVYEWLRGEPPFRGTLYEVVSSHLTQPPPSLCAALPDLPAAIEDVVFKALAKNPEQRFATAKGFALALERARSATPARTQEQAIHHAMPPTKEQMPIVREQKYTTHVDQQGTTPTLLRPSKRKRSVFPKNTRVRILTIIALLVLLAVIGPMIYVAIHFNTRQNNFPTGPISSQSTTSTGATSTAGASSLTPNANGTAIAIQQAKDMTATVQAQVRATAGVIQTATTATVLYQDPLTDGTSTNVKVAQWDQNGNCVFKQDGYHVSVGTDAFDKGQTQGCREDANTYQNFTATVDMSILSGHTGGIVFRLGLKTLGAYSGYLFEVDSQGNYKISASGNFSTSAGNTILQDWTPAKALKMGKETNTLQLIARGNADLLFYANGSFLTAIQDNTFTQGKLAFVSSSANGGANTEVVYDNLKITALP